jgi:hypothetical protein
MRNRAVFPFALFLLSLVGWSQTPGSGTTGSPSLAATLQFANIRQPNQGMVASDLSGLSKFLGTEVPGFRGFTTFRQLEVKIDYRDGLMQFTYDPSKLPPALRPR